MTLETRLIGALFGLAVIVVVLELIRRRHLQERYVVLWVITGCAMIAVALVPQTVEVVASLLGVYNQLAGLIGLLFLLLFAFALHASMVISRLSAEVTRLSQELAIERSLRERPDAD